MKLPHSSGLSAHPRSHSISFSRSLKHTHTHVLSTFYTRPRFEIRSKSSRVPERKKKHSVEGQKSQKPKQERKANEKNKTRDRDRHAAFVSHLWSVMILIRTCSCMRLVLRGETFVAEQMTGMRFIARYINTLPLSAE